MSAGWLFFFLLGWRWKYTHASAILVICYDAEKRDGWDLEFACEIWVESRLEVGMRIMAKQQQRTSVFRFDPGQTRISLSHRIKYSRTRSTLAVVGGGVEDVPVKAAFPHFPATHSASHSSVWSAPKSRGARHYNFPQKSRYERGVLYPFMSKVPISQGLLWRPTCAL